MHEQVPLYRRVLMALGLGRVTLADDTGATQTLQVQMNTLELRDPTPVLYAYGFTSNPLPGADAALAFLEGDRSKGVVIATGDQRYRLRQLAPGEVALFDNLGRKVYLSAAGIVIDGAGGPVTMDNATTVTINAATKVRMVTPLLEVTGDILDNAGTNPHTAAGFRDNIYNPHTHPDAQGGATGIPTPQA